jgi:HEPN domain-containing protein
MPTTLGLAVRRSLVRECLVDMGDRDYLAARISWRTRLPEQFLWSALQTVEKALKAILLFNDRSARRLGHDLEKALAKVDEIQDLDIHLHRDVRAFIKYLTRHGPNRYLERGFYLRGSELFDLDKTYWQLRRYCQDIRSYARAAKRPEADLLAGMGRWFRNRKHLERPQRYHLPSGYLEDVLAGKNGPEQYTALVWKNIFFGKRDKGTIEYAPLSWSAIPAHFRHPDVFAELAEVIEFPKDVHSALSRGGT